MSNFLRFLTSVLLLSLGLSACGGNTSSKPLVGLLFSDFENERWISEEKLIRQALEMRGYRVESKDAQHDVKRQSEQIDELTKAGAQALLIVAEDGDALVGAVDRAADAGVKVVAYDRLVKSAKIAVYLSFNNIEVGRQQAEGVLKALDIENWDTAQKGPVRLVKMAGSSTDNNAVLFRIGQDEALQPYVDQGKIRVVADRWVDNWDPETAYQLMTDILTQTNNQIDAVVASNDLTALAALRAMKAVDLAGRVPISGQDATTVGCNSIVRGELTLTIMKDIRNLAPLAVETVDQLVRGRPVPGITNYSLAELTNDKSRSGEVPCIFLPVQQVTKDTLYDLVVKSGFQSYDDVYKDLPEGMKPPRP